MSLSSVRSFHVFVFWPFYWCACVLTVLSMFLYSYRFINVLCPDRFVEVFYSGWCGGVLIVLLVYLLPDHLLMCLHHNRSVEICVTCWCVCGCLVHSIECVFDFILICLLTCLCFDRFVGVFVPCSCYRSKICFEWYLLWSSYIKHLYLHKYILLFSCFGICDVVNTFMI
jgi:hypothetical protein